VEDNLEKLTVPEFSTYYERRMLMGQRTSTLTSPVSQRLILTYLL